MPDRYLYIIVITLLLIGIISISAVDAAAFQSSHITGDDALAVPHSATPTPTSTPIPPTIQAKTASLFLPPELLDDFNRPNGPLGSNWSGDTGNYAIDANQLQVGSGEDIYWNVSSFGVGQVVTITLSSLDSSAAEIGLILKAQNLSDDDPAMIDVLYSPAGNHVEVWTYTDAQGWLQRGTEIPVTFSSGDRFWAEARANGQVDVYRNGSLIGSRSVTDWPYFGNGGYIGLFNVNAGNTRLDDFSGGTSDNAPTPTPTLPPCTDPLTCNPVSSISARWSCNIPECTTGDWTGAVIAWPWWAAFKSNLRVNDASRTVYPTVGDTPLYPYMKNWANGCQITAVSGTVLIIEWERGAEIWDSIYLDPGDSYTVNFTSPEDGILIEGPDGVADEFRVSLSNCNPPSSPKSFGETSVMNDESSGQVDLLYAQQATIGGSGVLESISIYVSNPSGQLRLGIYNDNPGNPGRPGTLLAETAPFTPSTGWNTQNLITQPSLVAGTYWLASLPQNDTMEFAAITDTGTNWFAAQSFGSLPGTFPASPTRQSVRFSIYATLDASPTALSLTNVAARPFVSTPIVVEMVVLLTLTAVTGSLFVTRKRRQADK